MAGLAHIAVGAMAGRLYGGRSHGERRLATIAFTALSLLPDIDVIPILFFGVEDRGLAGHRGFTHTFLFATLLAAFVAYAFRHRRTNALGLGTLVFFTLASHGVLDAFTAHTRGVPLFWPYDSSAVVAPFRPLPDAPTGLDFFSYRGLQGTLLEALFFLPMFAVAFWPKPLMRSYGARRIFHQGVMFTSGLAACLLCAHLLLKNMPMVSRAWQARAPVETLGIGP